MVIKELNERDLGKSMFELIKILYPICRSITGEGNRMTLRIIRDLIPVEIKEVPSGTKVFDWTVPKEWNVRDAYIKDLNGKKIIDFKDSNLHVLNYCSPIHKKVTIEELKKHIFTLPEHPEWIPYRTSYYNENWGFCMSHNRFMELRDREYEVFIDSTLRDGYLTYGEYFIKGETDDEVLISCHICHPSLCNDNLSGIALVTYLAKHLASVSLRYSYRFLFIPGTIGSITWLALNEHKISKIKHGLVIALVGDSGHVTYKKSRQGDAEIDRAAYYILKSLGDEHEIMDFVPYGYDERQFCSPGFDLPVGCFMRTPYGEFSEYHTSADNLDFIKIDSLVDSFKKVLRILSIIDSNRIYINKNPKCEPQLGKRGLYSSIGGGKDKRLRELAMLWVLNLSDGRHSLLDIAERSSIGFDLVKEIADILERHKLLEPVKC